MRIRCVKNRLGDFDVNTKKLLKAEIGYPDDQCMTFRVKDEYVVYGMGIETSHELKVPMFYFCDSKSDTYPVGTPMVFFEVIDPTPSTYWKFVYDSQKVDQRGFFVDEWCKENAFYYNLVEGESREEAIFAQYRSLMDAEDFERNGPLHTFKW